MKISRRVTTYIAGAVATVTLVAVGPGHLAFGAQAPDGRNGADSSDSSDAPNANNAGRGLDGQDGQKGEVGGNHGKNGKNDDKGKNGNKNGNKKDKDNGDDEAIPTEVPDHGLTPAEARRLAHEIARAQRQKANAQSNANNN